MTDELQIELRERLPTRRLDRVAGSSAGGCISKGLCYEIDNDEKIFVKTNSSQYAAVMFKGEFESLSAIEKTKTIRGPKPLLVVVDYDQNNTSAIAMEYLDIRSLRNTCAKQLGESLALLHDYNNKLMRYKERSSSWVGNQAPSAKAVMQARYNQEMSELEDGLSAVDNEDADDEQSMDLKLSKHQMGTNQGNKLAQRLQTFSLYPQKFVPEPGTVEVVKFGFDVATSCGSIPQENEWTDDWISFYARHRLDKSIRSLLSDHGDRELSREWSLLQLNLPKFFSDFEQNNDKDKIVPALLHGDLWSGNVAELSDGSTGVIYDPCSFYGHSEYEFGIARMFGGIPGALEASYFEHMPKKKLFEKRNMLYQLFHHLNHWDHFGSGYRSSSLAILKQLNKQNPL